MTKSKSKPQSLSARRSSPRTCSKSLPKPNPSPRTHSVVALPKPNPSPKTNSILRTPFSLGAITPIGTLKSISLSDWWLTKKEDKEKKKKALTISGFESKGGSEVRLFSSGTIFKRHNSITLEAIDGITICINGFINRSRSLENGISNEVCNRFLLGFPYNWEDYNEQEGEEIKKDVHTDLNISFDDDVPVSMLHDVTLLEGKGKILDDVVVSLRDLVYEKSRIGAVDKSLVSRIGNVDKSLVSRIGDVDKSLVSRIVGVKTRGMLRRSLECEASIGKRVHTLSKSKRS